MNNLCNNKENHNLKDISNISYKEAKNPKDMEQTYITTLQTKSIAVIVPIYNVAPYLKQCIESILSQSHTNFKLFLCDDESSDESLQIALEYAQKDSRVFVFSQKNAGQGSARNIGILTAGGRLNFQNKEEFQQSLDEESFENLKSEIEEFKNFKSYFCYADEKLIQAFIHQEAIKDFENILNPNTQMQETPNFDYLCFIDSDDFIKPNTFKNYLYYIQGVDFLYSDFEYFFDGVEKDENLRTHFQNYRITKEGVISDRDFVFINFYTAIRSFCFVYQGMINHSLVYKNKLLYPSDIYAEDLLFGVLLVGISSKIYVLQKSFYVYRIRENSSCSYDGQYKIPPRFRDILESFNGDSNLLKEYLKIQSSIVTAQKILTWSKSYEDKQKANLIKKVFVPTYCKRAKTILNFSIDPLNLKKQFYALKPYLNATEKTGAIKRVKNQLSYKIGLKLMDYANNHIGIKTLILKIAFIATIHKIKLGFSKLYFIANPKRKPPALEDYKDFKEAFELKNQEVYQLGGKFLQMRFTLRGFQHFLLDLRR